MNRGMSATDWKRPDIEAPLIVWEYVTAVERIADERLAENQRLRDALEQIAAEWDGNLGTGQMLTDFCREALAGAAE